MKKYVKENETLLDDASKHYYRFVKISALTGEQPLFDLHLKFVRTGHRRLSHGATIRTLSRNNFLRLQVQLACHRARGHSHSCFL